MQTFAVASVRPGQTFSLAIITLQSWAYKLHGPYNFAGIPNGYAEAEILEAVLSASLASVTAKMETALSAESVTDRVHPEVVAER